MSLLPIIFPKDSTVKVKVGDKVSSGQILAQTKGKTEEDIIHLVKDFGIPLNSFALTLKKNLGDSVNEGDIVAVKKGILGISSTKVISKFTGTVVKIDEATGDVYLRNVGNAAPEPVISPVDGTVEICNNDKIVIKTDKKTFVAKDGLGKDGSGQILAMEYMDANKLSQIGGKIVAIRVADKVSLFKLIGLDASGIITTQFEDTDFVDLSEKNLLVPVLSVSDEDFKALEKLEEKKAYLNAENKSIVIL